MFKLNNKGFAISGLFYGMLILFLFLVLAIIGIMANGRIIFERAKQNIRNGINNQSISLEIGWNTIQVANTYTLTELDFLRDVKVMNNDVELSEKITYITNYSSTEPGTYLVTYTTNIGGKSISAEKEIIVVDDAIYNFDYTGDVQTEQLEIGIYRLEVWGAKGGSYNSIGEGGNGSYAVGILNVTEETDIFVQVGGQGSYGTSTVSTTTTSGGYNGGGNAGYRGGSGGGATDIRINENSLYSRVIVAAGGGGSNSYSDTVFANGGAGGKTTGIDGSCLVNSNSSYKGSGGTQIAGGNGGISTDTAFNGKNGEFGIGGSTGAKYDNIAYYSNGAGGGGFFGGGAAANTAIESLDFACGGGGGSSYVYTKSTFEIYPEGCLLNEKYYLSNSNLIDGLSAMPTKDGNSTMTGNNTDGFAKITRIIKYVN